jgi:hypothetical protein
MVSLNSTSSLSNFGFELEGVSLRRNLSNFISKSIEEKRIRISTIEKKNKEEKEKEERVERRRIRPRRQIQTACRTSSEMEEKKRIEDEQREEQKRGKQITYLSVCV